MVLVTSYTEATLAALMIVELGPTATALGWTASSAAVLEAVADVELALGVTDVASSTNVTAIRALARLYAWRGALGALGSVYDWTTDGQSVKRSQMFDHAERMAAYWELEVSGLPGGFGTASVQISEVVRSADPYAVAASGAEF